MQKYKGVHYNYHYYPCQLSCLDTFAKNKCMDIIKKCITTEQLGCVDMKYYFLATRIN